MISEGVSMHNDSLSLWDDWQNYNHKKKQLLAFNKAHSHRDCGCSYDGHGMASYAVYAGYIAWAFKLSQLTVVESNNVRVVHTVEYDDISVALYQRKCNKNAQIVTD